MYELSQVEVSELWQQICNELEPQLSNAVYSTWILNNPLTGLTIDDNDEAHATFTCLTAFHVNNIKKNLAGKLGEVLDRALEKKCTLTFIIGTRGNRPVVTQAATSTDAVAAQDSVVESQPVQAAEPDPEMAEPMPHFNQANNVNQAPTFTPIGNTLSTINPGNSLPDMTPAHEQTAQAAPMQPVNNRVQFRSHALDNPNTPSRSMSPRVEDLFSQQNMQSLAVDRALAAARIAGLRPDYTFETFAVSTTNEMAHAAATAVSNRPGTAYNPLFLYGGVGVGKTHLMHAIGNNILKNHTDAKILYCTGEDFTNEIVNAIQNKKALKFKEKYRNADVMLIDDVQFIAGKNAVQEEFFHTFNALVQNARQIIMTSDRPPHEINLLEDRLKSRFEAGLMIDIQQPSFELRTAILLIKSSAVHINIPMDLAQLISSRVDSARKIEGIISSIRSEVELKKRSITAELIEEILQSETEKKRQTLKVSPGDIVKTVANHYRLKQAAIKGTQRHQPLVRARHVAMYLFREELNMPLTEIGRWFSNRDHTSALHGIRKVEQDIESDDLLQRDVSALRMSLTAISR